MIKKLKVIDFIPASNITKPYKIMQNSNGMLTIQIS